MDYQLYKQGNDLYVNITKGGFVGTIKVERVGKGTYIQGIKINRPKGGRGGVIVSNMLPIQYKVIFPNNHKTFDNRKSAGTTPKPVVKGYSLLSFIPGLPKLTSGYGWRIIFGQKNFHRGQDYANPPRRMQPVQFGRESVLGTLYRYYEPNGFGRYVYIRCDDGFGIVYAHLDAYGVPSGARVNRNSVVGYCGASGKVTAYHVHNELHKKFGAGFTPANAVPFTLNPR